jgi:hypothetical protein
MTPSGIEPATSRLVAQGLNQLRRRMLQLRTLQNQQHKQVIKSTDMIPLKHDSAAILVVPLLYTYQK